MVKTPIYPDHDPAYVRVPSRILEDLSFGRSDSLHDWSERSGYAPVLLGDFALRLAEAGAANEYTFPLTSNPVVTSAVQTPSSKFSRFLDEHPSLTATNGDIHLKRKALKTLGWKNLHAKGGPVTLDNATEGKIYRVFERSYKSHNSK